MDINTTVALAWRVTRMAKTNESRKKGMRYFIALIWMMMTSFALHAQEKTDTLGGAVTYLTSLSVYVKFPSTTSVSIGDTLFGLVDGKLQPFLTVKHLSSTSCVGTPLTTIPIQKGSRMYARIRKEGPSKKDSIETDSMFIIPEVVISDIQKEDVASINKPVESHPIEKSSFKGRLSAAAYINFADHPQSNQQRMRYVLNMNARRINHSGLSAEVYMSFRHTLNEWVEVQQEFLRAFKVYNLALEYDFNHGTKIWAGRKINFNISNIGAIDGVQAEKKWKKFLAGAFGGSRPDHMDYGFNPNLVQYGGYFGNNIELKNGIIQNTLALVEQRNSGMTDRRFMYFQHINSSIRRVYLFTSFEFDLYTLDNEKPKNTFDITSLYISARYRVSDKLSFFASFDSRNNVIYYETYKHFIDQLLEEETRQGFRLSFNYRPIKKMTIGANAGYRYQQDTPGNSKNLNTYITYSRIPGLNVSATANLTLIHSPYLDGIVYGVRFSRDIVEGKLFGEFQYRIAEYGYTNVEIPIQQTIMGLNLSWRITRMLSFSANYETEIQHQRWNNRIYTNLIQRF
ncbi:MAG TPA: hypothetical protein VGK46_01905 [Saprospiraceae bacterium]